MLTDAGLAGTAFGALFSPAATGFTGAADAALAASGAVIVLLVSGIAYPRIHAQSVRELVVDSQNTVVQDSRAVAILADGGDAVRHHN